MMYNPADDPIERLLLKLSSLRSSQDDRQLLVSSIKGLDASYDLSRKIAREPGVQEILIQMAGRISAAFKSLDQVQDKRILDIACGSNTSRAPASLYINTPFGETRIGNIKPNEFTAQFEPWFCRMLLELGAAPVGIDYGDLVGETFEHYRADLGQIGALDFLPEHSFDAVQDSRLFGSPEFTAQFPNHADRLRVAREIMRQEKRLLTRDGIIVHSDAEELLK
jgi:hypothetical protein